MSTTELLDNPIAQNAIGTLIAAVCVGVVTLCWNWYAERRQKHVPREETFDDIKNRSYKNPLAVFAIEVVALQIVWNLVFPVVNMLDKYLEHEMFADYDTYTMYGPLIDMSVFFGLIGAAVFFMSVFVAHRVKIRRWAWSVALAVATTMCMVIELSLFEHMPPPMFIVVALVFVAATVVPMTFIGVYAAKKTQQVFTMRQLFKRLPLKDKRALIELIDTLPSVAVPSRK